MNKKWGMSFCFATAVIMLLFAVAVPAGAGNWKYDLNRLLTGDYEGNSFTSCAYSSGGFEENFDRKDPNPLAPPSPSVVNWSTQSISSYDGHGGLTIKGQALVIFNDPVGSSTPMKSPLTHLNFVCEGTYQVNSDLTVDSEYACKSYPLLGTPPSGFYIFVPKQRGRGQMLGTMGNFLGLRTQAEPVVEEVYYVNYYEPPYDNIKVSERVCASSGIGLKATGRIKGYDIGVHGK